LRRLLADAGFIVEEWRDVTAGAAAWFAERVARMAAMPSPPPLGIGLLLGAAFPAMLANQQRNLAEGRIGVLQAVLRRA
jgi:hypothetical protein